MSEALIGFLTVVGITHVLLISVPLINTLKAPISAAGKLLWCAFLVMLPFIGVLVFHYRFQSSLFQGKGCEISAADERARL